MKASKYLVLSLTLLSAFCALGYLSRENSTPRTGDIVTYEHVSGSIDLIKSDSALLDLRKLTVISESDVAVRKIKYISDSSFEYGIDTKEYIKCRLLGDTLVGDMFMYPGKAIFPSVEPEPLLVYGDKEASGLICRGGVFGWNSQYVEIGAYDFEKLGDIEIITLENDTLPASTLVRKKEKSIFLLGGNLMVRRFSKMLDDYLKRNLNIQYKDEECEFVLPQCIDTLIHERQVEYAFSPGYRYPIYASQADSMYRKGDLVDDNQAQWYYSPVRQREEVLDDEENERIRRKTVDIKYRNNNACIESNFEELRVKILPGLITDYATARIESSTSGVVEIYVIDSSGKIVSRHQADTEAQTQYNQTLDFIGLPTGFYIIVVEKDGNREEVKVVKI